ncbi:hypothetical protein [Prauserella endophytica]|uniref:Uncharacterized protein n=1 Tax=Prauserella endophytica TaxID=1592324 RepID=A0ABY2RUX4_9PSEU|nr:hypothetical protein [Prauserella endophytica]TKG61533.1 hypothetical protein FCN18_33380 [Prauserella endophytica]
MNSAHPPDAGNELADVQAFDDLVARIYADQLPAATRELALALAWVCTRDPDRHKPDAGPSLHRAATLLGRDENGRWRHKQALAEDAPRYEIPRHFRVPGTCVGPRLRPYRARTAAAAPTPRERSDRDLVCGATARLNVTEHDMHTGQVSEVYWFCRRHAEHADRVRNQIDDRGTPPTALPNVGGYLGRYFNHVGLIHAYTSVLPTWTTPAAGLCRDDWPHPADVTRSPRRPRLALVISAG